MYIELKDKTPSIRCLAILQSLDDFFNFSPSKTTGKKCWDFFENFNPEFLNSVNLIPKRCNDNKYVIDLPPPAPAIKNEFIKHCCQYWVSDRGS